MEGLLFRRDHDDDVVDPSHGTRDFFTQLVISFALGLSAFIGFCILRPRWKGLYAARKRTKDAAWSLPELPDSLFGWIPTVYRITDGEVLASAGLDAFVFLSFYKLAIKLFSVTLFFALVVITPVHVHFTGDYGLNFGNGTDTNSTRPDSLFNVYGHWNVQPSVFEDGSISKKPKPPTSYFWMYVAFVYLFSALAIYLLVKETKKVIQIRQNYLSSQSTITDRTFRLSGIPPGLRSEEKIKTLVEKLRIGHVESITLCRNWKKLDDLMGKRADTLRRLEEAWTVYLGHRRVERNLESLPVVQPRPPSPSPNVNDDSERHALLGDDGSDNRLTPYTRVRPTTRIWYGRFNLQMKKVDAIDYYEEQLRKLDEQIKTARLKDYSPTPIAFVTMESIASCQLAAQAILDPSPLQLQAKLAPAPSDVIWQNTYVSRPRRMIRSWSVTALVLVLTIFWTVLLVPVAGLLSMESIHEVWPQLADVLAAHATLDSLVRNSLPTWIISLLNILVPYLYEWLSSLQCMSSQAEIELSVISKNFFFTFFNLFLVFTIAGTGFKFYSFVDNFRDVLRDTSLVAYLLARSVEKLSTFYANLIVLQGIGLFPFKLLEFGSVTLYPISLIGAKTPRDYAELVQPPVFKYGFFLPQSQLVFVICMVYSVLPSSWFVLTFGLLYFFIGHFVYKYQLLYAMDHTQHSTGRAWAMISNRIILGLIVFQLTMIGELALKTAVKRSLLIVPLLAGTVWFSYYFASAYEPLTRYIALRSLYKETDPDISLGSEAVLEIVPQGESRFDSETEGARTVDEEREEGLKFINPSLIAPLEGVWIKKRSTRHSSVEDVDNRNNVWADQGEDTV